MRTLRLEFPLHPKQLRAFNTTATELLFGGAAGPGKSHFLRVALTTWCLAIPGLQCYLFRRTRPDLWKNHMEGPKGFLALLAALVNAGACKINLSEARIEFANGSRIHLCHCEHENDVYKYQGAEIHVLAIDELTHFTAAQYLYLRGRVRMVGLAIPEKFAGNFPRVVCASNPGGIGHNWVKATFVTSGPFYEVRQCSDEDGGLRRQFIPARMEDNPSLLRDDPTYRARLKGLGSPELVRALEVGDWDIVAGGALDDVWPIGEKRGRLILAPFRIPGGWRFDRGFDWGSSKPNATLFFAESDGSEAVLADGTRRVWPKGTLLIAAERYGWNGKPNEGCRELATEIARDVLAFPSQNEYLKGHQVHPGPADPAIYSVEDGRSIASQMEGAGCKWLEAPAGPGSRASGLELIRARLKATNEFPMTEPGLLIFETCTHVIRTLPTLPRDPKKPDDVDTKAEDHPYDVLRYKLLTKGRAKGSVLPGLSLTGV